MQFTIREATTADAAAIAALTEQLGYAASAEETSQRLQHLLLAKKENCVLVTVHQEQVIGWIHGIRSISLASGAFAEISGLVVHEQNRGLGAGKGLVQHVQQWSHQNGLTRLRVRCNTSRLETHRFYTQLGFQEKKEQKVFELQV